MKFSGGFHLWQARERAPAGLRPAIRLRGWPSTLVNRVSSRDVRRQAALATMPWRLQRRPRRGLRGPQAPENLLFALFLPTKSAKKERKRGLGRSPKDFATTMATMQGNVVNSVLIM